MVLLETASLGGEDVKDVLAELLGLVFLSGEFGGLMVQGLTWESAKKLLGLGRWLSGRSAYLSKQKGLTLNPPNLSTNHACSLSPSMVRWRDGRMTPKAWTDSGEQETLSHIRWRKATPEPEVFLRPPHVSRRECALSPTAYTKNLNSGPHCEAPEPSPRFLLAF